MASEERSDAAADHHTWPFLRAAVVPVDGMHADGGTMTALEILAANPTLATASIHAAAVLGDAETVERMLRADPALATAKGGPHGWDALTHLCFSNFLKLDLERSDGFVLAARCLLEAGADANSGWFEPRHMPVPMIECVLYGAAGVAHHPELTALLLEHGANPNDDEVTYHVGESHDNRALAVLVATGRLTELSLATMLVRKCDVHDAEGAFLLLEAGANPNFDERFNTTPLHQALKRDNSADVIEAMLQHGADPLVEAEGMTAVQRAVRMGRSDVLALFEAYDVPIDLWGLDRLLRAAACGESAAVAAIAAAEPALVSELLAEGGMYLGRWALTDNRIGVHELLALGVSVNARWAQGDGYWGIPAQAPALLVAAWLGRHEMVELLIANGADVNARARSGDREVTALQLAVLATTDSYWTERRSTRSAELLLNAGASRVGVTIPTGYDEMDALLRAPTPRR